MDYRIEGQRLYLDGEPVSMFSGSVQYWRLDPSLWGDILERVRGMGFAMIETYIPWSVHEVSRGHFDFGKTERSRDLPRFLRLCGEAGLKVLARPGPHINAEMTYFGYPERLFADDEILARSAAGSPVLLPAPTRMFPVPCYHHPRFQAEVRTWLEALAGVAREAVHPGGPVLAIQVDNECAKFFRTHPFDQDYCEYAVRLYRRFLEEKYGGLEALNEAYRSHLTAWQLVDPPRWFHPARREELPFLLDWVEFGEYYINQILRTVAGMLRDGFGEGVPLFHNYPAVLPLPPLDMPGVETFLDFQGVDMYPLRRQYHSLRQGMKYTSGVSRLPMLVEFSSGSIYYALPLTLDDQRFTTRAAVMHGVKGINFYMAVERERWYGSPVKRDGTVREDRYEFYREFLAELEALGIEDAKPSRPVLLLVNREYERLASAATLLCPFTRLITQLVLPAEGAPDLLISDEEMGLSEPVASRYTRLFAFWYWALSAAGVHFAIGDTACAPESLSGYQLVIVPTFEFMDAAVQEKLATYARAGGALLIGPRAPALDSLMRPCDVLAGGAHEPAEVRRDTELFGAAVDEVSLFPADDEGGRDPSAIYRHALGEGWLIHLGMVPGAITEVTSAEPFRPLVDSLLRLAGVDASFVPADPRVDVSVFARDSRGDLVMVANPTDEAIETVIALCGERPLLDALTGEPRGSGGELALTLAPWEIAMLECGT